jgi:hypothetical protein
MNDRRVTRARATAAFAVAASIILLFAACSTGDGTTVSAADADEALLQATPDPEDRYDPSFVGEVEGTDILIGFAPNEGGVLAYLCNGDPNNLGAEDAVGEWFLGPVPGGHFDLASTNTEADLRLQGEQTDAGFTGTVTLEDGSVHAFTARAAEGDEGLYRERIESSAERGGVLDIGWINFNGTSTGAIKPIVITA